MLIGIKIYQQIVAHSHQINGQILVSRSIESLISFDVYCNDMRLGHRW